MAIQQIRGEKGEEIAANYLRNSGYIVVERNYRAKKSEIDIICKKRETLVFVEVKARTSLKFGNPETFVTEYKAAKIIEGAETYMIEKGWEGAIRFDIISVVISDKTEEVKHFKDAFY